MTRVRLTGYIIVPKGDLALIERELPRHIALTRQEPGCIAFEVEQSESNRLRFDVAEEFESREAFDHHQERVKASDWGAVTANVERHYEIVGVPD